MAVSEVLASILEAEIAGEDEIEWFATFLNGNVSAAALAIGNLQRDHLPPPVRITNYIERTVVRYSAQEFREHFRMHRQIFEELCTLLAPHLPKERSISVEKKVLTTLWFLGNQESFRSVGDRFDLSKGSLRRVILSVCKALVSNQNRYIQWPNEGKMLHYADEFKERCGFPGIIGTLDGTHIEIPGPSSFRDSYVNRKGTTSMQLQLICNKRLEFLDVYTGWPGSVHDARVFRNSPLGQKLYYQGLPTQYHLLGDSAYPLLPYLIVPFRDNGHLSDVEKRFNQAHSSTRVEIERAIGLLKGKFRKLKYLDMLDIDRMPIIIVAACVLHNFVIWHQGAEEDHIIEERTHVNVDEIDRNERPMLSAQDKRAEIAYLL